MNQRRGRFDCSNRKALVLAKLRQGFALPASVTAATLLFEVAIWSPSTVNGAECYIDYSRIVCISYSFAYFQAYIVYL